MAKSLLSRIILSSNLTNTFRTPPRQTQTHTHYLTLLRSLSSSSSPLPEPSSSFSDNGTIDMTDNCIKRMKELQATENAEKMLRLSVEAGGCSGFQYAFVLDDKTNPDDKIFEKNGVKLVVDKISYGFVKGASIDYVEELIRSAFQVTENPSAVGGCSCKSSFMVKQ